jgi:curved DNA-binding protein CbpA
VFLLLFSERFSSAYPAALPAFDRMTTDNKLEAQGIIQRHPIPELLVEINQIGLDGSLRISQRANKVIVYFEDGDIAFAVSNAREHRLFSILLAQEKIVEQDLAGIDDYVNDLRLSAGLQKKRLITSEEADEYFRFQIGAIIGAAAAWQQGNWVFSPLARLKEGLRYELDLRAVLFRYSKKLTDYEMLSRFKSLDEHFALNPDLKESHIAFSPQEAYVLSRIGDDGFSIEQLQSLSGLSGNELMPILYRLWLGGFIRRDNWNKAFGRETVQKFRAAKLSLRRSALSIEEEEKKKEEAARRAAEEEARMTQEADERKRDAEARKQRERREFDDAYTEKELSIEDYLNLVANAPTFYEMFGIRPDAAPATVKRAYFSYARRFHPDVLANRVEPERRKMIQQAFTEVAQAYETLRHEESRAIYDLKLDKVISALKEQGGEDLSSLTKDDVAEQDRETAARESFERGERYFDDGLYENAISHLGRAVHMENDNPDYHAVYGLALSKEKKNRHKAVQELQTAVQLAPGVSRYRLMLIELYVEIGLSVRARNELNRLLESDPGNEEARRILNKLD